MKSTVFKSVKGWGVDLAAGVSGNLDLERQFLERLGELFELFCAKNADYTPENVASIGLGGVASRLVDKVQRLQRLASGAEPKNESLRDTLLDIADYGVIALLVHDGKWPKSQAADLPDPKADRKLRALKALIHERGIATPLSQIKEILYD